MVYIDEIKKTFVVFFKYFFNQAYCLSFIFLCFQIKIFMASNTKLRVTVTLQPSGKSSVIIIQTFDDLLRQCSSKFRVKVRRIFLSTTGEELFTDLSRISNDTKLIVTCGDIYTVANPSSTIKNDPMIDSSAVSIQIIANKTLVEQAAVDQLNNVARIYPHVKHIWGIDFSSYENVNMIVELFTRE